MIEVNNTTAFKIHKVFLVNIAKKVLTKERKQKVDISVALVSPQRALELNKIYRKKSTVPDVLSFEHGEIILCPSVISKDAKKYGITFKQELQRVFIHGLLHLFRYNHTTIARREKRYL